MKHILLPALTLCILACSNSNTNSNTNGTGNQTTANELPAKTYKTDSTGNGCDKSMTADAVSGATNVEKRTSFNGILVIPPQNMATVTLTIGGIVKTIPLLTGEYIEKGEVIATLDNPEFIDLQQSYLEAEAQSEYLEKEYMRQLNLASMEAASQKILQQSKSEYLSVKSKTEALSAKLSMLGIDAENLKETGIRNILEIKAPVSGYVTDINANAGKYMNPGEPICSLIDKRELMLELTAYEKDLPVLKKGADIEFSVNGLNGRTFKATLVSIDQKVDTYNRSIRAYAKLNDSDSIFRPGMYVSAAITKIQ